MSEKRRALGRGLGALIPNAPTSPNGRPVDVFFPDRARAQPPRMPVGRPAGDGDQDGDRRGATGDGDDRRGGRPPAPDAADGRTGPELAARCPGCRYGEIPVEQIRPNPRQPRSVFDEDDMAELVHSIREIGVLQPIVIRPIPAGQGPDQLDSAPDGVIYELIMGERRWRASQEAGKATVPAIVKETEDDDLLRDALLENLHRSQLNAAGGGRGIPAAARGLRLHARRAGRADRPLAAADLQHAAAAASCRRWWPAGSPPGCCRPATRGPCSGSRRRRDGAGRPADRGRGAQRPQRRGDRGGRWPGRRGQAAAPARRHPAPAARRPGRAGCPTASTPGSTSRWVSARASSPSSSPRSRTSTGSSTCWGSTAAAERPAVPQLRPLPATEGIRGDSVSCATRGRRAGRRAAGRRSWRCRRHPGRAAGG